jgi:hypothetical protein
MQLNHQRNNHQPKNHCQDCGIQSNHLQTYRIKPTTPSSLRLSVYSPTAGDIAYYKTKAFRITLCSDCRLLYKTFQHYNRL